MLQNYNNSSLAAKPFSTLPNDEMEVIGSTVVYTLLALTIISGNSLVIAAYRYNVRLQTVTNTFLVGLAVSDLLVGLVSVPLWVYFSVCQQYHTCISSPGLQVFYSTADIFIGCASVLQLTAISIERFLAITRPIIHRTYSSRFYTTLIIAAWLYAFLMAALFPVQYTRWEKIYTVILVTTCFAVPTIMIFVVYVMIFKTAMFSSDVRVSPEGSQRRTVQQEAKIAVTIAVITGLFVVAWLPFFVVNVIGTFCLECLPGYPGVLRLVRFVKWMHYSNSVVNPVIYAYRNRVMRRTFVRLLRVLFCRCSEDSFPLQTFSIQKRSQAQKSSFKTEKRNNALTQNVEKNPINDGTPPSSNSNNANVNRLSEPFDSGNRNARVFLASFFIFLLTANLKDSKFQNEPDERLDELMRNWCRVRNERVDFESKLRPCNHDISWMSRYNDQQRKTLATDAVKSVITTFNINPAGEFSSFVIQTKTSDGKNKTFGGDSWRIMVRGRSSVVPTIFDLANGQYEVLFLMADPGVYKVEIVLDYSLCDGYRDPPPDWFIKVINKNPNTTQLPRKQHEYSTLLIYGDSQADRMIVALQDSPICKEIFKSCQVRKLWIYPFESQRPPQDDLDFDSKKLVLDIKQNLEKPEMDENSVFMFNLGLHYLMDISFASYQSFLKEVIDVIKPNSSGFKGRVIWKTTTALSKEKDTDSLLFADSKRFLNLPVSNTIF
ncbi:hypothetical protein QZH41_004715 [Actinostola sp. cb2023]|nr:hypothetical protein QZH41_004715 [Actinostola sp. cb2023]